LQVSEKSCLLSRTKFDNNRAGCENLYNMASSEATFRPSKRNTRETLKRLLTCDFNFHGEKSSHSTHAFHSFPAKFPPQLPAFFIENLTEPGDVILDPMAGSGTTLVEAMGRHRYAIGADIDPLAVELCRVKTSYLGDLYFLARLIDKVTAEAENFVESGRAECALNAFFDTKTREFVNYWFLMDTQRELIALLKSIEAVVSQASSKPRDAIKNFMLLCLSSIIIKKSGGVSLARDLAHSRPHRDLNKRIPGAIASFRERARKNLALFSGTKNLSKYVKIFLADAKNLNGLVENNSADLIVTSPPYSNAIDYMRTNKFSLVWLGYSISELSDLRSRYLGSEKIGAFKDHSLPASVYEIAHRVGKKDKQKKDMLIKYHSEMKVAIKEMYRVLKPDCAAIIVVGSSVIRDIDTQTQKCMAEIASQPDIGFDLVGIKVRTLDRNRRMMPWQLSENKNSQIEKRMGEEFIIFLRKPWK